MPLRVMSSFIEHRRELQLQDLHEDLKYYSALSRKMYYKLKDMPGKAEAWQYFLTDCEEQIIYTKKVIMGLMNGQDRYGET